MKISIDKIRLVTTLYPNEVQRLKNKYPNRKNSYFHYSYFQRKPNFFTVFIHPKNHYVLPHYNTMFSFNPTNPPAEALDIFKMIPAHRWMIKRLDIAFDFVTPLEETFLLPPPTRLQKKRVGDTQYFGAVNSEMTVCLYNKSKQLKDVYGISSIYPLTRVEFRFNPKLKPLTDYSHTDFKGMKKYYFVPNTRELRGFRWKLKKLTTGKLDWKNLKRAERESITQAVKNHVPDMYSIFMELIEGDILGFVLSSLNLPNQSHENQVDLA